LEHWTNIVKVSKNINQNYDIKVPLNKLGQSLFYLVKKKKQKISLIFKDFKADFSKRPDDDVYFTCEEGHIISKIIDQTINTGERVDQSVNIVATVPSLSGDEPVAKFVLTISVKVRKSN